MRVRVRVKVRARVRARVRGQRRASALVEWLCETPHGPDYTTMAPGWRGLEALAGARKARVTRGTERHPLDEGRMCGRATPVEAPRAFERRRGRRGHKTQRGLEELEQLLTLRVRVRVRVRVRARVRVRVRARARARVRVRVKGESEMRE